jgi:MarR family transcriptional regulator for hemolysin
MADPDGNADIGFDLALVARQWRLRADERFAPLGLTQARWVPLCHLARAGGSLPQRELVHLSGIEGPSLVRLLDELARLGLIERRNGDADRRTKTVHLADAARPIVKELDSRAARLRADVLDGISGRDLASFRKVLAQLARNLEGRIP